MWYTTLRSSFSHFVIVDFLLIVDILRLTDKSTITRDKCLLFSSHFYYCEHAKAHHHQCGTQLFAPRFHTLSSFDLEARPKLHRLSLYIYCYVPHYFDSIISGSNLVCLFTKEAKHTSVSQWAPDK